MEQRDGSPNRFDDIQALDSDEVCECLRRNVVEELRLLPISISLYCQRLDDAFPICVLLSAHQDSIVRGNAVLAFGHLARRFRTLDPAKFRNIYKSALSDDDTYVRSQAADMLDEIREFLCLADNWPDF